MDVMRGALREEKLSYSASRTAPTLGATYTELFPERVGQLVLDGAIDPR